MLRHGTFATDDLDAVLFDMDDVVTDTAEAHALAWKRLFDEYLNKRAARAGEPVWPFDAERDYHEFDDGKPRYDGVESFLASRRITVPRGDPDDDPGRETICGLGNRENRYFQDWLRNNRVQAFPGTLAFIRQVKGAGLRVALFSSSRNSVPVLRSVGVLDLFDALLDGDDLVRCRLPGKPDPAMLLEAARRLAVRPERAAIVEDAIAGVEAGVRGGFRPVIGIDRDHNREALLRAGATLVVRDLDEIAGGDAPRLKPASGSCRVQGPDQRPSASTATTQSRRDGARRCARSATDTSRRGGRRPTVRLTRFTTPARIWPAATTG